MNLDDFIKEEATKVGLTDLTEEELKACKEDLKSLFNVIISIRKVSREFRNNLNNNLV